MGMERFFLDLAELTKNGLAWRLDEDGCITSDVEELCPIHQVCLEDRCELGIDVYESGKKIGLKENQVRRIMKAADNKKGYEADLRARLLRACGVLDADDEAVSSEEV